jgi:hypothetical protein
MICVLVPLMLQRNAGVLFGHLRCPPSVMPSFLACYGSVSLWCLVVSILLYLKTRQLLLQNLVY